MYSVKFTHLGQMRTLATSVSESQADRLIRLGREMFPHKVFLKTLA